jgi:hypothetical protein
MLRSYRTLLIGVVLTSVVWLSACTTTSTRGKELSAQVLDGAWEGRLDVSTVLGSHDEWKWEKDFRIRLHIRGAKARIDYYDDGKWGEINRPFTVLSNHTNAVITSIYKNNEEDAPWVETWSFSITSVDAQRLNVLFQRHVNNTETTREKQSAVFGEIAYGHFLKVSE